MLYVSHSAGNGRWKSSPKHPLPVQSEHHCRRHEDHRGNGGPFGPAHMGDAQKYPEGVQRIADQRDDDEFRAARGVVARAALAAKSEQAVADIADRHGGEIAGEIGGLRMEAGERGEAPVDRGLTGGDEQAGHAIADDLPEERAMFCIKS